MRQRRFYHFAITAFILLFAQLSNANTNAEKLYADKHYKAALSAYQAINPKTLDDEQRAWHNFRLEELNARIALRAPKNHEAYQNAIAALIAQAHQHQQANSPNIPLIAQIHNALGELAMANYYSGTYVTNEAMQHFRAALNTWGKSADIATAKPAFLSILRHIHHLANSRSYNVQNTDISMLQKAIELAEKPADKALFAYQLAELHKAQHQHALAHNAFKIALEHGAKIDFHDRIVYNYALFLENWGHRHHDDKGTEKFSANYAQAKAFYQRVIDEHGKNSGYYNSAEERLENITRETVQINLPGAFHSSDQPQFTITWRNLSDIDVAIYRVDLSQKPPSEQNDWLASLSLGYFSRVWKKTLQKSADQPHYPLTETVTLDEPLAPGAYVIYSDDGHKDTRALLLVTDIGMAISSANNGERDHLTAFIANTQTGQPQANAAVTLWQRDRHWQGGKYRYSSWQKRRAKTGDDGLVTLPLDAKKGKSRQFMISTTTAHGAAILSNERGYSNREQKRWKLYAYTDRPLYRPGDTVRWKTLVRYGDGFAAYEIPQNRQLKYRIIGPQGNLLREKTVELSERGTVNGEFTLPDDAGLGAVRIEFRQDKKHLGRAELFRIEEFKRPEYQVNIAPKTAKQYQLGDAIPLSINANYYSGGAVTNATVEVIVRRSDYYHLWKWAADDSWLSTPRGHHRGYGRHGYAPRTEVLRQNIRTDATGKAEFVLDTDATLRDQTYHLEARVVDASRREVVATLDLSVTQAPYFAYLRSEEKIVTANQPFNLDIKLLNAQNQNVAGAGKLIIERAAWQTFWLDKHGQRFEKNNDCGCLNEQRQLKWENISTNKLAIPKIDDDNAFKHPLKLIKNGFYRLRWQGENPARGNQPLAETNVWVMDGNTRKIDQPNGALTLLTHPAQPQPGDTLQIYLISQKPTHVWLTHAHNAMDEHQTLQISDNVAYAALPITAEMQPNFMLNASAFLDDQFLQTQQGITVKPQQQFLDISVSADQANYRPREQGQIRIRTQNHRGEPVSAEVSLTVVDESLYYIQPDNSPDIRQFFYGQQRHFYPKRMNSMQQNRFAPARLRQQSLSNIAQPTSISSGFGYSNDMFADGANYAATAEAEPAPVMEAKMRAGRPMAQKRRLAKNAAPKDRDSNTRANTPAAEIIVRNDFRATALWLPTIVTDNNGEAQVPVTWPDTLTRWKTLAKAIDDHSRVGSGESQAVTRQPFIARLQKPRFLTVGDAATITAVFNNNLDEPLTVTPTLSADNAQIASVNHRITIPANSSKSADWQLRSHQTKSIHFKLTAQAKTAAGKTFADASAHHITAYEYGITKSLLQSGRLAEDVDKVSFALNLPRQRKAGTSQLNIQLTPSIAVTMLDALPYLAEYPYGCTEQTLSRFVPTMIVSKTLADLGLDKGQIAARSFGGISNNYREKLGERSLAELNTMRDTGLKKLLGQQNNDGGWGWWPTGQSDAYMSAYVVWGLSLAQQHKLDLGHKKQRIQLNSALQRGRDYLATQLGKTNNAELTAWMLHAATNTQHLQQKPRLLRSTDQLWKLRDRLSSYGQALLALSLHRLQDQRAKKLLALLADHAIIDDKPDQSLIVNATHSTATPTAYWGKAENYLRWQDGAVETTSWALMALLTIAPDHKLVVPAMNWLVKNRRGAQWHNTRDTAMTVLALNQYLQNSRELQSNSKFVLRVNGREIARKTVKAQDVLIAPSQFEIDPALLKSGANRVEIQRLSGNAPLYFLAHAEFFTQEDNIPAAGHEIFVERFYERLDSQPTLLSGNTTVKNRLKTGDNVRSGERFEVVLLIEAKNDYEYLMFEDFKPAGLEAVQLTSGMNARARQITAAQAQRIRDGERVTALGYRHGNQPVYQEMRDRKVANFITKLPQGFWEIRYTLRAETPGQFAAMPTRAKAMYVPEVKGNSSSRQWEILPSE